MRAESRRTARTRPNESEDVNGFVRSAAIDAFLVLEHSGQMPREEVVGYFQRLFGGRLKRAPSQAWGGLVSAVADLPAPELLDEVRRAYADDLVDLDFATLEGIERDLRSPDRHRHDRHKVITDAINELAWWSSFHPEDSRPKQPPMMRVPLTLPAQLAPAAHPPPRPVVRPPKVGRNDPCPCASGKKYKKCCGKW